MRSRKSRRIDKLKASKDGRNRESKLKMTRLIRRLMKKVNRLFLRKKYIHKSMVVLAQIIMMALACGFKIFKKGESGVLKGREKEKKKIPISQKTTVRIWILVMPRRCS
jgi:hypothetical protein